MIVTRRIIEEGRSKLGGFSINQAICFGIDPANWPTDPDGRHAVNWDDLIIGKEFPRTTVRRFLRLKDKHLENRPRAAPEHRDPLLGDHLGSIQREVRTP